MLNSTEVAAVVRTINPILAKLTKEQIEKGMRTFEINGMAEGVFFDSCFVAMLYGEPSELLRQWRNHHWAGSPSHIATERLPLTRDEVGELSIAHFEHPHIVFTVASEYLNKE
jgi:hypothetical protein